jgi:hypothetical protein
MLSHPECVVCMTLFRFFPSISILLSQCSLYTFITMLFEHFHHNTVCTLLLMFLCFYYNAVCTFSLQWLQTLWISYYSYSFITMLFVHFIQMLFAYFCYNAVYTLLLKCCEDIRITMLFWHFHHNAVWTLLLKCCFYIFY